MNIIVLEIVEQDGTIYHPGARTVSADIGAKLISRGKARENSDIYQKKEVGKGLSSNDFTSEEKQKLASLSTTPPPSGPVSLTSTALADLITAEGIVIGQVYNVTDKGWILTGTGVATLGGSITLMNGEELPAGVEPEMLWIDTGEIGSDVEGEYDTLLTDYSGYHISAARIKSLSSAGPSSSFRIIDSSSTYIFGYGQALFIYELGEASIYQIVDTGGDPAGSGHVDRPPYYLHHYGYAVRWMIELHRSNFDHVILIPTLSTPYSSEDGTIITAPFDHIMRDPTGFESDFTLSDKRAITSITLDGNNFIITPTVPIAFGDVATLSITAGNIKNTWGGLFAGTVEPITITNNVPEPV